MSTTTAIIVALLVLAALVAVVWGSFWVRNTLYEIINDPDTMDVWKLIFFLPFLAFWIVCFIFDIILLILCIWMAYDTAKQFRNWWHQGAK